MAALEGCYRAGRDERGVLGTAVIAAAGVGVLGAAYISAQLAQVANAGRLRKCCAKERLLVLTYDDGPGEVLTPRLLDLLKAHEAVATFFLLGSRAELRPHLVDQVVAGGHDVGCHTHKHLNAWKSSPWAAIRDINRGYESLSRWVPRDGLFRPPYGKVTAATWAALARRSARSAWWTVDSRDTTEGELPTPESIVNAVGRDGGGVVLLHDFDRDKTRVERERFVLETTEALLRSAKREGMRIARLKDVLAMKPGAVS